MTETALVEVGPLQQALALATETGDLTRLSDIHAMAGALRKGAQARGLGIDAENQAAEIVLRAERAIGEGLIALKEAGLMYGGQGSKTVREGRSISAHQAEVRLDDLGIERHNAQYFQRVAAIPADEFEQMLATIKAESERIARAKFLRAVARPPVNRELLEAWQAADAPPVFAAYGRAVEAMLAVMHEMPNDVLAEVYDLIKRQIDTYQKVRADR